VAFVTRVFAKADNARLAGWTSVAQFEAARALIKSDHRGRITREDVALSVVFYLRRFPKDQDIDKMLRALLDALTGILFVDDRQVRHVTMTKRRPRVSDGECTHVSIWEMGDEPPATLAEYQAAQAITAQPKTDRAKNTAAKAQRKKQAARSANSSSARSSVGTRRRQSAEWARIANERNARNRVARKAKG
jgi:Holliday junction resolvase RusA-like endonuclease